jgi:hypothetical protein
MEVDSLLKITIERPSWLLNIREQVVETRVKKPAPPGDASKRSLPLRFVRKRGKDLEEEVFETLIWRLKEDDYRFRETS